MPVLNNHMRKNYKKAKTIADQRQLIDEHFSDINDVIYEAMTTHQHLILWGDPGTSKTSMVYERAATKEFRNHVTKHKNKTTPIDLYKMLYENSGKKDILILDDCEDWFTNDSCHSTLMSATDSINGRIVQWHTNSNSLRQMRLPNQFVFDGAIIICTNRYMPKINTPKTKAEHKTKQILSRMEDYNVNLPNNEWQMIAIRMIYEIGKFDCFVGIDPATQKDIIDFVDENRNDITDLSFRTIAKIVKSVNHLGKGWQKKLVRRL